MPRSSPPVAPNTAEKLIRDLRALNGARCRRCGTPLCGHVALMNIALGCGPRPSCLRCLGEMLARESGELRDSLHEYLQRQDCHRAAWAWASRTEGFADDPFPRCVFPAPPSDTGSPPHRPPPSEPEPSPVPPAFAADWDAGDLACGELVLELRRRLQALSPGAVFRLQARDPSVPGDLPAWCRLTGHRLLHSAPPVYHLQRKA